MVSRMALLLVVSIFLHSLLCTPAASSPSIPSLATSNLTASLALVNRQTNNGLTGDDCNNSQECKGSLECWGWKDRTFSLPCDKSSQKYCLCIESDLDIASCASTSDCGAGEVCAPGEDYAFLLSEEQEKLLVASKLKICVSSSAVSRFKNACVGAHHLEDWSRKDLLYAKDQLAKVLCDKTNNCATEGHMVVWNGENMMMKQYCELNGGCKGKAMKVNSPRYGVRKMVKSNSEGLLFSALSAKWATEFEQRLLNTIMRMGF